MSLQFVLTGRQLDDLAIIRDMESSKLREIINLLAKLSPAPFSSTVIHKEIKKVIPEDESCIQALVRQLMSWCSLIRERRLDTNDVVSAVSSGLVSHWNETEIEKWQGIQPLLHELLSLPNLWFFAKVLDLSYEYENLFQNAKIVTDVRPVFDKEANNIEGAVISFTLRLYFDNANGSSSISIAMDTNDISRLLDSCKRALQKAEITKEFVVKKGGVPSIICGEDDGRPS